MSVLRRPERRSGPTLAYMLGQSGLPIRGAGRPLLASTPDRALQHSAVWACVRLLSSLVGSLPVKQYRSAADAVAEISPGQLVRRPSQQISRSQWISQAVTSMLLRGNAYGRIVQRSGRFPTQIEWLDPSIVVVSDDGRLSVANHPTDWSEIFHIPWLTLPGSRTGLSPLAYHAQSIGVGLAALDYGAGFFNDGGVPPAVISANTPLTKDQANAIKSAYLESRIGNRSPAVFGADLKIERLQIAPDESQFLATQRMSGEDICRVFGVPAEMVGLAASGSAVTYVNREQRAQDLLTYTVMPLLTSIEEALTDAIPAPQLVRFDTSALVRADIETQYKTGALGVRNRLVTPNEWRAAQSMPPIEGGDEFPTELVPPNVNAAVGDVSPTGGIQP